MLKKVELKNILAVNQVKVKLFYKGHDIGKFYAIDILVENEIIIEIKCADILHPVYTAQLISYLKLSCSINKDGIKRFVNNLGALASCG